MRRKTIACLPVGLLSALNEARLLEIAQPLRQHFVSETWDCPAQLSIP
jgi:hypothetical protein